MSDSLGLEFQTVVTCLVGVLGVGVLRPVFLTIDPLQLYYCLILFGTVAAVRDISG